MAQQLESMSGEEFQQLVNRMVEKLSEEGYINTEQPGQQGRAREPKSVKFQVTDKSVDFLGFKTLKDLMAGWAARVSGRMTLVKCRRVWRRAGHRSCMSSAIR